MNDRIQQLTAGDFEEAMDFLNLVFSGHAPTDFEKLLPAIYRPTDAAMGCHYAIREGGRIRAIVGMYPIQWRAGQVTLSVAGIGAVSTHPRFRGSGHMTALMEHCVQVMEQRHVDLSWLGGQRQRYGNFGYERCGQADSFSLNRSNLKHCFSDAPGIRFAPLELGDSPGLARARELHDAQLARCVRAEDRFHDHLRGWRNTPHAALDVSGRMVGYLVASSKGDRVTELVAESDHLALRMLRSWTAERADGGVTVELPAWRGDLVRSLGACCENVAVRSTGNFRIYDWERVVGALLGLRALSGPLATGAVSVGVAGYGTLEISVSGDVRSCRRTDARPDLEMDPLTAMRAIFGPQPPSRAITLPPRAAILDQWCPLPLFCPQQDGV